MIIVVLLRISEVYIREEFYPLMWARYLKSQCSDNKVRIYCISMDTSAKKVILNTVFDYGADRMWLLSERSLAGSDTYVTAKVIATAINQLCPDFDLILANSLSNYGETGHVPFEVAAMLGIPFAVNATDIHINEEQQSFYCNQHLHAYEEMIALVAPCLVSLDSIKNSTITKQPTLFEIAKAAKQQVEVLDKYLLTGADELYGKKSFTKVIASEPFRMQRHGYKLNGSDDNVALALEQIVDEVLGLC